MVVMPWNNYRTKRAKNDDNANETEKRVKLMEKVIIIVERIAKY